MDTKPKRLKAIVTIELPIRNADSQEWDTYNVDEMAKAYKEALEDNLLEEIEMPYELDELTITATVEILEPETAPTGS